MPERVPPSRFKSKMPSLTQSPRLIPEQEIVATLQNFRDYYGSILKEQGAPQLQKIFLAELESSTQLPPEERAALVTVIQMMQEELLGQGNQL